MPCLYKIYFKSNVYNFNKIIYSLCVTSDIKKNNLIFFVLKSLTENRILEKISTLISHLTSTIFKKDFKIEYPYIKTPP